MQIIMIITEIISVAKSRPIIVLLTRFLKKTICITAGKIKVVNTSVKLPIRPNRDWNEGIT